MKLSEKYSGIICSLFTGSFLRVFVENSPERTLKKSLEIIDNQTVIALKNHVRSSQTASGGFRDRAGNADLYYTLFGYFLAEALGMPDNTAAVGPYLENDIRNNNMKGVHLHCAAILSAKTGKDKHTRLKMRDSLRKNLMEKKDQPSYYNSFLGLLSAYYLRDYIALLRIARQLQLPGNIATLPCSVLSALLVLQHSFGKPPGELKNVLFSLYRKNGGFAATQTAPVTDLLSTAVALYALNMTGYDLRSIKPDCLNYVDSLYRKGGFAGHAIDQYPDIEYTFYGLLALGSLII